METVLITGATSGIGYEIAKQFAYRGEHLVLVSRNYEALAQIKNDFKKEFNCKVDIFSCDLSLNYKAVYDFCSFAKLDISILVNNAGFGDFGLFVDADIDKLTNMIDLNDKALVGLTYLFLQDMLKANRGTILNVGSVASFVPGPYMAVYYASKAFVSSFSLALRQELKDRNIKVCMLAPSPTKSNFWLRANATTSDLYNKGLARTPLDAAKTAMRLIDSNKAYSIDGLPYKIITQIGRLMPLTLITKIIGFIQSKTKINKKSL